MIAESIRQWVHEHTEWETMDIIRAGEEIFFQEEKMSTANPMVLAVIHATFLYFAVEKDRAEDLRRMAYLEKVEKGKWEPKAYLGYRKNSFKLSSQAPMVRQAFQYAADGKDCTEIAEWLNEQKCYTPLKNTQTARSVRRMLTNPVYVGDVVYTKAGVKIEGHHKAIVDRELWNRVQERMRYERRLAAARGDCIEVMKTYKAEIEKERKRMNASKNGFVRTCCQQTIDQLTAEKRAIEEAVVG